ncbi:MAG: DUF3990 domain-containing protein [Bacteroidales bacterium]|nr:DUF3990 domain-containing protein [Bacteroidales bacterium]
MLIYHASDVIVDKPDTIHSRTNLDFGKGFYATVIKYGVLAVPGRHYRA